MSTARSDSSYNCDASDARGRERVAHWKTNNHHFVLSVRWDGLHYPPFTRAAIDGVPIAVDIGTTMDTCIRPDDMSLRADGTRTWSVIDIEWRWHEQPWVRDSK